MVYLLFFFSCLSGSIEPAIENSQPNFVVIDIDSLRWDRMVSSGSQTPYAPNIEAMAYDGIFFNSVYTPASWTYPALTGLLTGQIPPISDYDGNTVSWIPKSTRTFPEILRYYGYTTSVFWGETLPAKETRFSEIFNKSCVNCTDNGFDGPVEWLESQPVDSPFFLFVHNLDLHHYTWSVPFEELHRTVGTVSGCRQATLPNVADKLRGVLPEAEVKTHVIAHYDGMLRFYDQQLSALFDAISEREDAKNTVVIILSNHGEALFESKLLGHARIHHERVLRTGLIWNDPQISKKGQNHAPLSLLDVAPTILERAGVPKDHEMMGTSFLPLMQDKPWKEKPVYAMTDLVAASIIDGPEKLSMQYLPCPKPELKKHQPPLKHNTCSILINRLEDPDEQNDLSQVNPEHSAALQAELVAWITLQMDKMSDNSGTEANEELKATLKNRGYWGDSESVEADQAEGESNQ